MPFDPQRHHRRSVRLSGYDYAQAGAYFVTICVQGRECVFGLIANGAMDLNCYGYMVASMWDALPDHYPTVELDVSVVMPNHFHGIILLSEPPSESARPCTLQGGETPPLPERQRPCTLQGGETPPLPAMQRLCALQGGEIPPLPTEDRLQAGGPAIVGAGFPRPGRCNDGNVPSLSTSTSPDKAALMRPKIGQIVAYFKYQTTKAINQAHGMPGIRLWQRSFHDHVIRSEESLGRLREYVVNNPLSWELDQLHPDQPSKW